MVVFRALAAVLAVLWSLLLLLTGGRFLMLLLAANEDSAIVQWLYDKSEFWVAPFIGLAGTTSVAVGRTGGTFEPGSLIAVVVYAFVGALLLGVVNWAIFGTYWRRPLRSRRQESLQQQADYS